MVVEYEIHADANHDLAAYSGNDPDNGTPILAKRLGGIRLYLYPPGGSTYQVKCNSNHDLALQLDIVGLVSTVTALAYYNGELYAGGRFSTGSGFSLDHIARRNDVGWLWWPDSGLHYSPSSGLTRPYALCFDSSDLYVAGLFTHVDADRINGGGISANNIAKIDMTTGTWSALGSGTNALVQALAHDSSNLYAGGNFSTAGGVSVNKIAKWNGSAWSDISPSPSAGNCTALLYAGGTLYAAFESSFYFSIRSYNGSTWTTIVSDIGTIYALVHDGSDLYVGGGFSEIDGVSADYIASYNGSTWSALGSGTSLPVTALYHDDSDLYVGGEFSSAGGDGDCNRIAKWNGSAWSPLGTGLSGDLGCRVDALTGDGTNIYAAGYKITSASGVTVVDVAKWNGSAWSDI